MQSQRPYAESLEQAVELVSRILADPLPSSKMDAMYVFTHTSDNQISGLERALQTWCTGLAERIVISGAPSGRSGCAGIEFQTDFFRDKRTNREDVIVLPDLPSDINLNTRSECVPFVEMARKRGWYKIGVTIWPGQQLRGFISAVSVAVQLGIGDRFKIHSLPGIPLLWDEHVVSSQGTTTGTRAELITGEWKKLATYRDNGDLLPIEEVFAYLKRRDKRR